jgi:formate dehydrogenase major subunit
VHDHRQRRQAGRRAAPAARQNNVQGASDAGLIPMFYPTTSRSTPTACASASRRPGAASSIPSAGLTVTEIVASALHGGVRGMYMMGENPFLSDPNINKVRKALSTLDFLVVQDIFLTETAEFADVILPATTFVEKDGTYTNTDRRVQIGRKVLDPPGQARPTGRSSRTSPTGSACRWTTRTLGDLRRASVADAELRRPALRQPRIDGKLYPNPDPVTATGRIVLFDERFGTDDGLAHLVPAEWMPAKELPSEEYPFVLNTGGCSSTGTRAR